MIFHFRRLIRSITISLSLCFGILAAQSVGAIEKGRPVHALALHGEPLYGPDFTHFGFVNPDAPKSGTLTVPNKRFLTFDTFNSFNIKGTAAVYLFLMHDTLMTDGADEPSTSYCLVCETVEVSPDNSSVTFALRPEARFNDGSPITADDIEFSFNILITDGAPIYRTIWADVDRVEKLDPHTVTFHFKTTERRDLPQTVAALPVLSKTFWETRDFAESTLDVPVVSGPYAIEEFDPGRFVSYGRVRDYWGKDLSVNRGMYNFDSVRVEYFRDDDVRFEAFKRGIYEFRRENISRNWATGYEFPGVQDGRVKRITVPTILPMTIQHESFNLRREKFQKRRVRQAINYAFDFESLNQTLFYGLYKRQRSYWQDSELEAKGLPGEAELAILEPFRDQIPPEVFTEEFVQPTTDGQGNVRQNLLAARELLREAGYEERDGKLVDSTTGEQLSIEFLLVQAGLERVILPFTQNLQRLGIDATLRIVDTSQYTNRTNDFDFDMAGYVQPTSLSPGSELRQFYGSETADQPGSLNWSGLKDPVVDALIDQIVNAEDRETLVNTARALDRVMQWNFYRVLTYGSGEERYAYWNNLKQPDRYPAKGLGLGDTVTALWWHDPNAPDDPEELVAQTSQEAGERPDADTSTEVDASEAEQRDTPYVIIIVAVLGVLLLLWSNVRRRNKK